MIKNGGIKEIKLVNLMSNIKSYNEFLNEGFFDFINKPIPQNLNNPDAEGVVLITAIALVIISIFVWTVGGIEGSKSAMITAAFMDLPIAGFLGKLGFSWIYNQIRAATLLGKTNRKYEEIAERVKNYPDLEERFTAARTNMVDSVQNKNKEGISFAIHEIYDIAKEIVKREKLSNFFNLSDEEKEKIKNKYKTRKKVDPYGEEQWGDEKTEWWAKGNKAGKPSEQ